MKQVITILNQYFKYQKLNQQRIATDIGVTQSTISNILSGKKEISALIAKKLEQCYGIRAEWLLYGNGEMLTSGEFEIPVEIKRSSIQNANDLSQALDIIKDQQTEIARLTRIIEKIANVQ